MPHAILLFVPNLESLQRELSCDTSVEVSVSSWERTLHLGCGFWNSEDAVDVVATSRNVCLIDTLQDSTSTQCEGQMAVRAYESF